MPGSLHAQRAVDRAEGRPANGATLRTIFAQPDRQGAHETIARIGRLFERRFPKLVALLQKAEGDILADHSFSLEHRRPVWSTNALERLNREVGRRCEVVGIFRNRSALLRLVGAILQEQNDEWAVGRRYFSQESMRMLLEPSQEEVVKTLLELETAQCPRNRTLVVTPLRATSPRESSILSAPTHTIRAFQEPNF